MPAPKTNAMAMSASESLETMYSWGNLDAADNLLCTIDPSYYKTAKRLAQEWDEAKVWRGAGDKKRVRKSKSKSKASSPRRDSASPGSGQGSPPHVPKWTAEQREEAAAKKSEEAAAAAAVGLRKSKRVTMPTERLLNADVW